MMPEDTIIRILRRLRWTAVGLIVLLAIGVAVLEFRPDGEPATEDVSAGTPTISVPAGVPIVSVVGAAPCDPACRCERYRAWTTPDLASPRLSTLLRLIIGALVVHGSR
jgi:hypothetical protein